jgi:hypothetical protein
MSFTEMVEAMKRSNHTRNCVLEWGFEGWPHVHTFTGTALECAMREARQIELGAAFTVVHYPV